MMEALYHPDMLALQRLLFGEGIPFKFDHAQVITREPSYPGGNWHSHFNGDPHSDNAGPCSDPSEYGRQRNVIFVFAYPDGFGDRNDGSNWCVGHTCTAMWRTAAAAAQTRSSALGGWQGGHIPRLVTRSRSPDCPSRLARSSPRSPTWRTVLTLAGRRVHGAPIYGSTASSAREIRRDTGQGAAQTYLRFSQRVRSGGSCRRS